MQSIAKSMAEARDLAEKLSLRFAGSSTIDTVRQSVDAQGWPMLFCSDGASEVEGASVILIRIKGLAVLPKDQFQQNQFAYAPHTLEVAYELTAGGKPIPLESDLWKAVFESTKTGIALLQKEIANGTAVSEASSNAAAVLSELNDLYWPNKGV